MKNILFGVILILLPLVAYAQIDKSFNTLDREYVMKRLFDNAKFNSEKEILWQPNYSENFNNRVSDDNLCHTKMDTIMYYHADGYDQAVMIFTTAKYENGEKESCHVCAPTIGIATFKRSVNTNWEIEKFQKNFTTSGSTWGESDKFSLTKTGNEVYCLTSSSVVSYPEEVEGTIIYYSLESENLGSIFGFQNYYSNENNKENGYNSKTVVRYLPSKDEYYTIELIKKCSNSRQIDKRIYKYSSDKGRYIFIRKVLDKK